MQRKIAAASLVSLIAFLAGSAAPAAQGELENLARTAVGGSPAEAAEAVAGLRRAGPAGMEAMLALAGSGDALDRVCGVRDCADIRLFWYTDLEAAKDAARATGKPILSLRLMGRLDEELSCANSRFFRTVFYKNEEINRLLRERFVLHWRSVRPVPKVTIDFGDGSRLERTLTGNSIHYALDSRGRLLDALPGLYGPKAFESALLEAERGARAAASLDDAQFAGWSTERHTRQLEDRTRRFSLESWALPVRVVSMEELEKTAPEEQPEADRLPAGGADTGSKSAGEGPILGELLGVGDENLELDDRARLRRPHIHLDPASRAFLLRKHGVTDPEEARRLVETFETTVALDEVINEYRTGPAILRRLIDPTVKADLDLEAFNLWVYEEVFKTPLNDPWLGLASKDVYTALPASTRMVAASPGR